MGFLATILATFIGICLFNGAVGGALLISYLRFSARCKDPVTYNRMIIRKSLSKKVTTDGLKSNSRATRSA